MIATIFDIDGTLVESFGFDDACYISAIREVLGEVHIHNDWSKYKNVTDTGSLRQIMEENKIREKAQIKEVRTKFGELIRQYLQNSGKCCAKEGAIHLINKLTAADNYEVGFATGGWRHTAKMKLQHAGFNLRNTVLTSSDDGDERVTIMKKCLFALGNNFQRIVYIGDAEWDMQATQELGWHFIGVGARLKGKCNFWVEDFSNYDTFMKMLHA
ncbi:HAD hydrolase-like protein [Candidatus Poribacteria bacterium]|nr:HAD hydrolase-like protein [Candidatus Poribacteria bacterium]MXY27663.1 HAD hydrolase-like protein [Candidatus Poribacteria bacterium]MYK19793.1 HAD hydrolase-like protein [Candidatus Poribacteria bacterium]